MRWWHWLGFFLIGIGLGIGIAIVVNLTSSNLKSGSRPIQVASHWIPIPPEPNFAPIRREPEERELNLSGGKNLESLLTQMGLKSAKNETPKREKEEKKLTKLPPLLPPLPPVPAGYRTKLVIIMDDMAFEWEVNRLHQLHLKITPSFFPPTRRHPYTSRLAQTFPVYMVHLPLESRGFKYPEENTLPVSAPYLKIRNWIRELKQLFPRALYYNNHTGSTFTADQSAMKRLFRGLKFYNLGFLDSGTTPFTKSYDANLIYQIPLLSRDIFLDNRLNQRAMAQQLLKAVKLSQKRGIAILICHPYRTTFKFLKRAEKWIDQQVEVVYITDRAVTQLANQWKTNFRFSHQLNRKR